MTWWQRLRRRADLDRQISRELQVHIDQRVTALTNAGLNEDDARRQALQDLGGLEQVKEVCRDARGTNDQG